MDHRFKCKTENYKTFRIKPRKNLGDLRLGRVLKYDTEHTIHLRH